MTVHVTGSIKLSVIKKEGENFRTFLAQLNQEFRDKAFGLVVGQQYNEDRRLAGKASTIPFFLKDHGLKSAQALVKEEPLFNELITVDIAKSRSLSYAALCGIC